MWVLRLVSMPNDRIIHDSFIIPFTPYKLCGVFNQNITIMKSITTTVIILLSSVFCFAQKTDTTWNVMIIKKGETASEYALKPALFSPSGFYLYRNVMYYLVLNDGTRINGLLLDVKKDSIVISNHLNAAVAKSNLDTFKVLTLHYTELKQLKLIVDRALDIFKSINLKKYDFVFTADFIALQADTIKRPYYVSDTANNCADCMDCFMSLGYKRLDIIYEKNGFINYYRGATEEKTCHDSTDSAWRTHNIVWFAPVAHNTVINGWAISAMACPAYGGDTLVVNGINTEIGAGMFFLPYLLLMTPDISVDDYDTTLKDEETVVINGISISCLGHISASRINGVSLNWFCALHTRCDGVVASYGGNIVGEFNGLVLGGVKNHSTVGRGVQIGLFNSCTQLKGFQFGLLNRNQKRTLPFVNWCFN